MTVDTLGSGVLAISGPHLLTSGRGTVYISTDHGTAWKEVATGYPNTWFEDFAADDTNLFASGRWDGVFRSTNGGLTWMATTPALSYWEVSSVVLCGTHLFAGTFGQGVLYSTNNGATWSQTWTGLATNWVNNFTVKGTNVFAAAAEGVFLTSDSGLTWRQVSEGLPTYPTIEIVASNDTFLFAGTGGRGVWRRPLSEIVTGVEAEKQLPADFKLEQNYPNPFNPSTTIRYALPHRSHVTLALYNTLGQLVATLVNGEVEAGDHEIHFDAHNLASGVYFYRLQAGDFVATKRLMVLK